LGILQHLIQVRPRQRTPRLCPGTQAFISLARSQLAGSPSAPPPLPVYKRQEVSRESAANVSIERQYVRGLKTVEDWKWQ